MFLITVLLSLQFLTAPVSLAEAAKLPATLVEAQARYAKGGNVQIDVAKELTIAVLKKKKSSKGKLNLSGNGKFRLEITEPSKSLVVMDGKDIWVVEYPDFEDEKVQVIHSKFKDQLKSQVLLKFLMGEGDLMKHFKLAKQSKEKGNVVYTLTPKSKDVDLKSVKVTVDPADKTIGAITYVDNLDTEIRYTFSNEKFYQELDKKLFTFKPPKNSEVSEMN